MFPRAEDLDLLSAIPERPAESDVRSSAPCMREGPPSLVGPFLSNSVQDDDPSSADRSIKGRGGRCKRYRTRTRRKRRLLVRAYRLKRQQSRPRLCRGSSAHRVGYAGVGCLAQKRSLGASVPRDQMFQSSLSMAVASSVADDDCGHNDPDEGQQKLRARIGCFRDAENQQRQGEAAQDRIAELAANFDWHGLILSTIASL